MKRNKFFILIFIALLISCEEELDMGTSQQIPIIYCIFNRQDSIHQVVLSKTLWGYEDSRRMGKVFDSLFYEEANVYFEYERSNTTKRIYLEKNLLYDKEPGFFSYPDHIVYQTSEKIPGIQKIGLFVEVPGLPIVSSIIDVLTSNKSELVQPHDNGVTIGIFEDVPWRIELSNNSGWDYYREAKIELDIIEGNIYREEEIKKISFNKIRYSNSITPPWIEISWDRLMNEILYVIKKDPNVNYRKFGIIKLTLYKGDKYYEQYVQSYYENNDYKMLPEYSNIENGLGLFSSKSYIIR
ncbi:hypothetical protein ACFLRG_02175, partial [Bacteroidota bacterium]